MKFRYEKLPTFCFVCGCIGHTEQSCEVLFSEGVDDGVRGWSVEVRADARRGPGGSRSRWLKDDRRNPNDVGGEKDGETDEMGRADFHGGYAENMHAASASHANNKGKSVMQHVDIGVGPGNKNSSNNTMIIRSHQVVDFGVPCFDSDVTPPIATRSNEPHVEKKRRREGEVQVNEEAHRLGFDNVITNPLATGPDGNN